MLVPHLEECLEKTKDIRFLDKDVEFLQPVVGMYQAIELFNR